MAPGNYALPANVTQQYVQEIFAVSIPFFLRNPNFPNLLSMPSPLDRFYVRFLI